MFKQVSKILKRLLNKPEDLIKPLEKTIKAVELPKEISPKKRIKKKVSQIDKEKKEIEKYSEFLRDFGDNLEQKRAVVSDSNKILVLAGAGSGKTKVLTKRVIHLVKNKGVPIHNILAIQVTCLLEFYFNNKHYHDDHNQGVLQPSHFQEFHK